jgi:tetratricopeptide (TPR) repeat protein
LLKNDFKDARLLRAEVALVTEQYEKALSDIGKVLEQEPDEESAYLLRGRIHEAISDYAEAAGDYNRVLELNPFNEEASLLLASLLIKENRPDEAIGFLDEIIDLNPLFAKAYAKRGKAKDLKGDKEGSLEDMKKAEELAPENGEAGKPSEDQSAGFDNMYKGGIY